MSPGDSDRLRRIAFVSRRFADLQGLRPAALGAGLIGFSVLWSLAAPINNGYLAIFFGAQLAMLVALRPLDRFYQKAFGRVTTAKTSDPILGQSLWVVPGGLASTTVLMALSGDALLQVAFKPAISLAAVALTAYSLMILLRDGVLRAHYLVGVAAGLYALLLSTAPEVGQFESRVCGVVGLALFALGLLDHRLLAVSLCQPREIEDASLVPPVPFVRLRITAAATCFAVLVGYVAWFGSPRSALGITLAVQIAFFAALIISLLESPIDFWRRSRPYSELTRAREQRLLARVCGDDQPLQSIHSTVPPALDVPGHVLMPLLIGCGAIADVTAGMVGMPSMLALSLAASHLWIAVRDWPRRTHYLLGSAVAAISAVHYMFLGPAQRLEWFVWFLILVSTAMVVEGLLDLRLHRQNSPEVSEVPHVDTL
jgi:hypothetical protein